MFYHREQRDLDVDTAHELCMAVRAHIDLVDQYASMNFETAARSRDTIVRTRATIARLKAAE
jgi:hypothetical protein